MRVLITGGMGVIGAEASRKFVGEGHRPVLYSRHRDESLIRDILDKVDIELGSILDRARLADVIKSRGVTHVVHTAAYISALSAKHPAESVEINVMGTVNVLEAARAAGVERVVYTSAKGVYGPFLGAYGSPTYKLVTEDHPKEPKRIYDSAKLMGENATLYWGTLGLDVVVLRFATTYGPGKTARHGNMGVTSQIIEQPASGQPFRIAQGGDEKDDFIYNKDSALGIYLATVQLPRLALSDARRLRHFPRAEGIGLPAGIRSRTRHRRLSGKPATAEAASGVTDTPCATFSNSLDFRCASATGAGRRYARRWRAATSIASCSGAGR